MRKEALIIAVTLVLLLAVVVPAAAITWGEPDNGEHPYVGFMIFFDPLYEYPDGGWFSCSGTLLDETTFLTAGHCTYGIGTDLEWLGNTSGGTDVWVTFVEEDVLDGFPWDPDPAIKNALRYAWLNSHADYVRGQAFPHPQFDYFYSFPNTRDVGVVVLSEAKTMSGYGVLPDLGQFDYLDTAKGAAKDRRFTVVGYGIQGLVPPPKAHPYDDDDRFKGETTLTNTRSVYTSGYNFQFTNSPGQGNGAGGTCYGDSGGPALWADTNIVAAITSYGITPMCTGLDFSYRADISETLDFVGDFLD